MEEKRELLPKRAELMRKLCNKLGRPNQDEIERLFEAILQTDSPVNLLCLFEIICCRNLDVLTSKILPRIQSTALEADNMTVVIHMLNIVWKTHRNLEHFLEPTSNLFNTIVKEASGQWLVASIASCLGESHVNQIKKQVFDKTTLR